MKAIIFHGTDSDPNQSWYQWLKSKLEQRGYEVEVPSQPDINKMPMDEFVPGVLKKHAIDEDTVLIGHSSGALLILGLLEKAEKPVAQAILVAGYCDQLPVHQPFIKSSYDWEQIKANAGDFIFINSENDPWGCDDKQGHKMFSKLGGTLIIKNDKHFSTSGDPKYKEFPMLAGLVMEAKS